MFGRLADAIGDGIADARDKIVFEGFFDLHTPERNRSSDLGWSLEDRGDQTNDGGERSLLDYLYETNPEHFTADPASADRDFDRGIDR